MRWPWSARRARAVVAGHFQLSAELANKRGIGCQVSVLEGEDEDSVNARIDLAQRVIERQRARCEVPELEAALDQRIKALEQFREVLAELERRQREEERLSSQELQTLNNLRVNIRKGLEDLDKGRAAIEDAKRRAA